MIQLSAEVQASAEKAQMVYNSEVKNVDTDAIAADELRSFVEKNYSGKVS